MKAKSPLFRARFPLYQWPAPTTCISWKSVQNFDLGYMVTWFLIWFQIWILCIWKTLYRKFQHPIAKTGVLGTYHAFHPGSVSRIWIRIGVLHISELPYIKVERSITLITLKPLLRAHSGGRKRASNPTFDFEFVFYALKNSRTESLSDIQRLYCWIFNFVFTVRSTVKEGNTQSKIWL